jgi:TetR/AcrR family transcriptional repressor of nem operon
MARTREYDADDALERALHHFWQNGYLGTSIEQLVDATGVQRYGLYQSFTNKHGLFVEALRRYQNFYVAHRLRRLEEEGAGLDAIESVLNDLATVVESPLGRFGCLLCNTAVELGGRDEVSDEQVRRYVGRLRSGFRAATVAAIEQGELEPTTDPDAQGDHLAGVVVGAYAYARTGPPRGSVRAMVETTLERLPRV